MNKVLKCFGIAVLVLGMAGYVYADRFGQWNYVSSKDEFDDTDRSYVFTQSQSGRILQVRIMDDGINIIYFFNKYLGGDSDNDVIVRYRIDDKPASKDEYWRLLQGHKGAFSPMNKVKSMLSELGAGKKIVMQVRDPMDGETMKDEFSLDDFNSALAHLRRNGKARLSTY